MRCSAVDEPAVVGRIDQSLKKIKRQTSKVTGKTRASQSLLDARKPFVLDHYYWNLNRDCGVYFELLTNQDLKGKWQQAEHSDMGLLLMFVLQDDAFRDGAPLKKTQQYVDRILKALGVPYEKIAEGDEREEVESKPKARKAGTGTPQR
ncbi:MAG: hypothetical protein ACTHK7_11600 [Aureliella sp.]